MAFARVTALLETAAHEHLVEPVVVEREVDVAEVLSETDLLLGRGAGRRWARAVRGVKCEV